MTDHVDHLDGETTGIPASGPRKVTGRTRELVLFVDKLVYRFTYHWGLFINFLLFLFVAPFFLAPLLTSSGYEGAGRLLYTIYKPACHQLPERSFFLGGPRTAYSWDELVEAGMDPEDLPTIRRDFVGSAAIGYKTVVCQRDVAIYGGLLIFGAIYMLFGRRHLGLLPLWTIVIFLIPLGIDGTTQILRLRESSPALRLGTGLFLAAGIVIVVYPYIEAAMLQLRGDVKRKLKGAGVRI